MVEPLRGMRGQFHGMVEPLRGMEGQFHGIVEPIRGMGGPFRGKVESFRGMGGPFHEIVEPLRGASQLFRGMSLPPVPSGRAESLTGLRLPEETEITGGALAAASVFRGDPLEGGPGGTKVRRAFVRSPLASGPARTGRGWNP
jgi:hypothetical protein